MNNTNNGKLIVLTAPSGAGKTTIKTALLEQMDVLDFSISATTRSRRENEVNGKDYYFLTVNEFESKIANGEFVEWEEVYKGKYYGTLKSELERIWSAGHHVVLDIDVEGAKSIKKAFGDTSFVLFIKPPSVETLLKRLRARDTETPETLKTRIDKATYELQFAETFDAFIINDDLDLAIKEAKDIVSYHINA